MQYLDYINQKLSQMSDSELQNFSEQCNFNVLGALGKLVKHNRRVNKFVDEMYSGAKIKMPKSALNRQAERAATRSTKATKSVSNVDRLPPTNPKATPWPPRTTQTIAKSEPKAIEKAVEPKEPFSHVYAGGGEAAAKSTEKAVTKEVATTEAKTASNAAKQSESVAEGALSKFSSPAEAVAANKTIQNLDQKILKAVKDGNPKRAAELRRVRSQKARDIELAYHKAYSGKLRNIHEWGRDHKWVSAPIGVAGALGAGAVASAGAAGVAGVVGLNKAADAVFD